MGRRAALLGLAAGLLLLVPGPPAAAESEAESSRRRARELAAQAAEQLDAGSSREAERLYREAYQLYPDDRLQYGLGMAYEKQGRLAEAANAFEAFLVRVPTVTRSHPDLAGRARQAIERLAPRLGRLELRGPADARFQLEGESDWWAPAASPARPVAVWLSPGRHRLTFVDQRGLTQIDLQAGKLTAATLEPAPPPRWRAPVVAVLFGASASLLALGAVGVAEDGACVDPPECRELRATRGLGIAGLLTGGVMAIAAGVLLWWPRPPHGQPRVSVRTQATSLILGGGF
jgi:tetratricopeptide (TPR) repeat protein